MSFPPYASYKDSGVEWLGQVPSQWKVERLKVSIESCRNGIWGQETDGGPDDIICVRVADFDRVGAGVDLEEPTIRSVSERERGGRLLRTGDLLLEKSGGGEKQPVGAVVLYGQPEPAVCSNFVARMRLAPAMHPRFWTYVHSAAYAVRLTDRSINQTSGIQNLDQAAYLEERAPYPPTGDQAAIADFLDRETAKIDALVEAQRRLIALLKEKRQAVISHAVTKGLDPSAPLKPSGIPWLGDVPGHWEVLPLTRVVSKFVDYRGATPNKVDMGIPLVTAGQIKNGRIDHSLDPAFISEEEYETRMTRGFPARGDLLLTTEAPLGEAALIADEGVAPGQRIILMKINERRMTGGYLLSHFQSPFGQAELWTRASGSTASGIRADRLRASQVLVPPVVEQRCIRAHIDEVTEHFDMAESEASALIALLTERRAALISAAVTGKIDVRGLVSAPEAAEAA